MEESFFPHRGFSIFHTFGPVVLDGKKVELAVNVEYFGLLMKINWMLFCPFKV